MIRVAICENQKVQQQLLREECTRYFEENSMYALEIAVYDKPARFLDGVEKSGGCDLALLSISRPGMDGLAVARELRMRSKQTEIIFLSSSGEYALEAYGVYALAYLLKPVSSGVFREAMDRAMTRIGIQPQLRMLLQGESSVVHAINLDEVLYIESFRNYRSVCTVRGTFKETRRTLTALLEELEQRCPGQFISPYRGYIINLDAVSTLSPGGITLKNGKNILIKSGTFRKLRDIYFRYESGRMT